MNPESNRIVTARKRLENAVKRQLEYMGALEVVKLRSTEYVISCRGTVNDIIENITFGYSELLDVNMQVLICQSEYTAALQDTRKAIKPTDED